MTTNKMQPFWDRVNAAIKKHDTYCDVPQTDVYGKVYNTSVSKMILCGYLEIKSHGIIYRSIPVEHGILWVSWNPFKIVGHFSALSDPDGTIKWIKNGDATEACGNKDE